MQKLIIVGAFTALFLVFTPAIRAQNSDEVERLRRQNELLKNENELLKKQIEQIKKDAQAKQSEPKETRTKEEQAKDSKDLESLKGTWTVDAMGWGDKTLPKELMKGYKFVFDGNKLTWEAAIGMMSRGGNISAIDGAYPCDFKIDAGKEPKHIDITFHKKEGDRTLLGIYEVKGDALKVCYYGNQSGRRPTDFSTNDDAKVAFITLSRAKKSDKAPPK